MPKVFPTPEMLFEKPSTFIRTAWCPGIPEKDGFAWSRSGEAVSVSGEVQTSVWASDEVRLRATLLLLLLLHVHRVSAGCTVASRDIQG